MNIMSNLAEFLGVEASKEAVLDRIATIKTALLAETLPDGEVATIKSVTGSATSDEVVAVLDEWAVMVNPPATLKSEYAENLKTEWQRVRNTAPAQPAFVPHQTAPETAKTSRYDAPKVIGRAPAPTMRKMVEDIATGKSHDYQLGPQGGYLVPEAIAQNILPPLRASLVVAQAGASILSLPDAQTITLPKWGRTPDAYWVTDGPGSAEVPETDASFEVITLNPKPLAALVKYPKRLLSLMADQAEKSILEQLIKSMQLKLDYAALMGVGAKTGSNTGAEPLGLLNRSGVTTTTLGVGSGDTPAFDDVIQQFIRITTDNIEEDSSAAFIMHPRDAGTFKRMADTQGQPLMRANYSEPGRMELDGKRILSTTQLPINVTVGGSSDTGYIFAGVWKHLQIVMGEGLEIQVLNELYANKLQVGVIAHMYADIGFHYEEAFDILAGVRPV